MNVISRNTWFHLAGALAVVACAPAAVSQPGRAQRDLRGEVAQMARGQGAWRGRSRAQALDAVVRLGAEAASPCVDLFLGRIPEKPQEAPRWDAAQFARDALERLPGDAVEQAIAGAAAEPRTGVSERRLLASLLGEHGTAESLPLLLELCGGLTSEELQSPFVRAPFASALRAILERDPEGLDLLALRVRELPVSVAELAVGCLGGLGNEACVRVLEQSVARDLSLDLAVLDACARFDPETPEARDRAIYVARTLSNGPVAERVRAAVLALGRLGDDGSADLLVELLSDPDARTQAAALHALQELAGATWSGEPERWRGWLAQEQSWFGSDFPRLTGVIEYGDDAEALEAMRELSSHALWRRAVADVLGRFARDAGGERAVSSVAFLAGMDDPDARYWLGRLREQAAPEVSEAARKALGEDPNPE